MQEDQERRIEVATSPAAPEDDFRPVLFPEKNPRRPQLSFEDMRRYMEGSSTHPMTSDQVTEFANSSRDKNLIHIDPGFAEKSFFRARIAHGMLTASHVDLAVQDIIGPAAQVTAYNNLTFTYPVKIDDTQKDEWQKEISTTIKIVALDHVSRTATLAFTCSTGVVEVLKGQATITLPSLKGSGRSPSTLEFPKITLPDSSKVSTTEDPISASFENLKEGEGRWFERAVTAEDIRAFKEIVTLEEKGDEAPLVMIASYFSALFGTRYPGMGAIYILQTLKALAPLKAGDTVRIAVKVTDVNPKTRRVKFDCEAVVGRHVVALGAAELWIPEDSKKDKTSL